MVISVSWSSPDPRFLDQHIGECEQRPFTGTLINLSWPTPAGGSVVMSNEEDNPSWAAFEGERLDDQALRVMAGELREIPFRRSQDNFRGA